MSHASLNRQIGSVFLIVGTEVGGGILALPIIIAHVGIVLGGVVLLAAWALMLYTALLLCEANATMPDGANFATMANKFLGGGGKILVSLVFWFTLTSIAMAFISAAGSTFDSLLHIKPWLSSSLFVILFGACVIIGTQAVDYVNRLFLSIKLGGFLVAIAVLCSSLSAQNLFASGEVKRAIAFVPAIVTAFILHNIIPSIRSYLHNDKLALKRVIIIGSLIPLVLYLLWVIAIIGNIPSHGVNSFEVLFKKGSNANVGDLLTLLSLNSQNRIIPLIIDFVATISITTSFLGTSISLYHFIIDVLNYKDNRLGFKSILPIGFTFILPLLIVFLFPNIFILALNYAGAGATILFVLLPVIFIKQMIKKQHKFSMRILHNNWLLNLAFLIGVGVVLIQFLGI